MEMPLALALRNLMPNLILQLKIRMELPLPVPWICPALMTLVTHNIRHRLLPNSIPKIQDVACEVTGIC